MSDEKLLAAMARFEGALARASAGQGLFPAADAQIISRICEGAQFDSGALAREGRAGTLASPFVNDGLVVVTIPRHMKNAFA